MSREPLLVVIGILIALTPFSGLPLGWLEILVPALGALVVGIGITLVSRKRKEAISVYEAPARDSS